MVVLNAMLRERIPWLYGCSLRRGRRQNPAAIVPLPLSR